MLGLILSLVKGEYTMIINKNETGRSMVEMLGVLAIIGVLSVAGIAGYTLGMSHHRANEIANATAMLYMIGSAQNQGGGTGNLAYTDIETKNPSGVESITYNGDTDKSITIVFKNQKDCVIVKDKLGDKAPNDCATSGTSFALTANLGGTTETRQKCTSPANCDHEECIDGYCVCTEGYCTNGPDKGRCQGNSDQGGCSCVGVICEAGKMCDEFSHGECI